MSGSEIEKYLDKWGKRVGVRFDAGTLIYEFGKLVHEKGEVIDHLTDVEVSRILNAAVFKHDTTANIYVVESPELLRFEDLSAEDLKKWYESTEVE